MRAGAGSRAAGRLGYDPVTRRRVRRTGARLRPLLLPASVLVAAVLVLGARAPDVVAVTAPAAVEVPAGRVLVAVQPDDAAVLALALPGSRIDVYAAASFGSLDPLGGSTAAAADLVVRNALVVVPPATAGSPGAATGAHDPSTPGGGGLLLSDPASGAGTSGALTLVVTDQEAAALAARPDGALLVAVRGSPWSGSQG